jgi:hypothetical protein
MGNRKHNPGEPMHHARGKSMDHAECIQRHQIDRHENGGYEPIQLDKEGKPTNLWRTLPDGRQVGPPQVAYTAWRALAQLQEWLEANEGAPLAPGAKLPSGGMSDAVAASITEKLDRFLTRQTGGPVVQRTPFRQIGGDGTLLRCSTCSKPAQKPGMCDTCRTGEQAAYLGARERAKADPDGHGQYEPRSIDDATREEWDAAARRSNAMSRRRECSIPSQHTSCIGCDNCQPPTPRTDERSGA